MTHLLELLIFKETFILIENERHNFGVTLEIKEIIDLWNDRRFIQKEVLEKLKELGVRRTTAYKLKRELKKEKMDK